MALFKNKKKFQIYFIGIFILYVEIKLEAIQFSIFFIYFVNIYI
jgi:hypothetical protein